jgi:cyclohexanecarboxylate-CoA ligase
VLSATRPHLTAYDLADDTFGDVLRAAGEQHAESPAISEGAVRVSYGDLLSGAVRFAAGLQARGVRPGDRVLTQLPNWWETVVASWGVFLAGGVLVPVVPIYRSAELRFVIAQVRPAAVVAPASFRSHDHMASLRSVLAAAGSPTATVTVRGSAADPHSFAALLSTAADDWQPVRSSPDDVAVVLYTSGTTADPKGALHSHRTLLAEVRDVTRLCRLADGTQRVFMGSPLSHITGLSYGILLPVDLGAEVVLQERWDPAAAAELIEQRGCTFTVSATPFLRGLADEYATRGRSSLQTFVCGGADIPAALVRRAHDVMGTRVVRTYGSTELPTSTMADPFGDIDSAATGEGRPMGGNEIRIEPDDRGSPELLVRGPELFLGYLDERLNNAAFSADGFFRTGDLAAIDDDGTLRITGRIKDIINRGGEKFSAAEVEAVLLTHPDVLDVAVVGYPDPVLVERACAFVVHAGERAPSVDELRNLVVGAGLAVQKAPELVLAVETLPRTASGKVQRFVLRDQARALVDGSGGDR